MAGRRANGEGMITYDKRRKRYRAKVTIGWELNEKTGRSKQITKDLGSNFKTKGEAARALSEYQRSPYNLDDKNITFSELYERWFPIYVEKHESGKYRIRAAYKYCSLIYDKKFRDLSILDMENCIYKGTTIEVAGENKGKEKLASPSTQESIKSLFNNIYAYAVKGKIVEHNIALEFSLEKEVFENKEKNRKIKEPFSDEQMNKLWNSIDFVHLADIIVYACYSGWRPTEIVEIKTENVHLDEDYIIGGIKTKAGIQRVVPIHPLVKSIVEKYYNEAVEVGSKFLFNDTTKKKGIGLSYDQYLSRFHKIMSTLKFSEEITPHYTRHTFITKAKKNKIDEYILKLIVGHRIEDMTERIYTHRVIEELKEELFKIEK